MAEAGDELLAAGEGDSRRVVASQAGREQVLDALNAAFVSGRLTKGEFDQRSARCSPLTPSSMP